MKTAMSEKHYVYIAACADGTWYTGWSTDPARRIRTHNAGRGAKYTRSRLPVQLIFTKAFDTKEEALHWEYAIKQMTRRQKEQLVREQAPPGGWLSAAAEDTPHRARRGKRAGGILAGKMGKIFYLMGKSASGKDHLYERLLADERLKALRLKPLVIYTTRPMRDGEEDGVTYHFTDEARMEQMCSQGKVVESRCYQTVQGPWYYFTADDGQIDLSKHHYLAIGTPEAYKKIRAWFGPDSVRSLYVETDDGIRLERALKREQQQRVPQYAEMCRRFLADQKDFAPAKLKRAGIDRAFENNGCLDSCVDEMTAFMLAGLAQPQEGR